MSTLTRWRPLETLLPLGREFNDLWRRWFEESSALTRSDWGPSADILETPEEYVVKMEVPGMQPEDVTVTLNGEMLTLRGEKKQEETREDDHWHVVERSYGSFERTLPMPGPVGAETVQARINDGVLEVHLKKAAESRTRRVEVKG